MLSSSLELYVLNSHSIRRHSHNYINHDAPVILFSAPPTFRRNIIFSILLSRFSCQCCFESRILLKIEADYEPSIKKHAHKHIDTNFCS
jgi:hypothetical protein